MDGISSRASCGIWEPEISGAMQQRKPAQCKDPKAQDPLQAIVAYDKALKAEKIKLLVVPIPPKAVIYPEKLADGNFASGTRYDASLQRFYQELKKQGVEVLDLTPLFLSKKKGL